MPTYKYCNVRKLTRHFRCDLRNALFVAKAAWHRERFAKFDLICVLFTKVYHNRNKDMAHFCALFCLFFVLFFCSDRMWLNLAIFWNAYTARTLHCVNIENRWIKKTLTPVAIPAVLICRHGIFLQFFFSQDVRVFSVNHWLNFMLEITINWKRSISENSFMS